MKVLVTGASGFVGRSLTEALRDYGHEVTASSRSRVEQPGIFYVHSPELAPEEDWVRGVGFASGYRKGGSGYCHCKIEIKSLKTMDNSVTKTPIRR
jgi:NAD(P)-dependent dehydrogenase (short-subunit alcohol dehydrogenase family)